MREYSQVRGRFWTGPTGRRIREKGPRAQMLALYLCTGPSMNMIGLYYLPIITICHETGLAAADVQVTLRDLEDAEFAYYDQEEELVWIPNGARYQIGDELHGGDKRIKGVKNLLRPYLHHKFGREFVQRYKEPFSLLMKEERKPLQAPPKPGTGTGSGAGTGERTDPPPQTPPPNGAKGLRPGPEDADPWALPPGLTPDEPSPNSRIPTVSGTPLRRALERLIAGEAAQGREVGDAMRKKLRKRLAGGALEHDLAAQLREAGERRQRETAEERKREQGYDEALAWIKEHGGNDCVIAEALRYLDDHPPANDVETQDVLRQWANQAHAPPEVVTYILPSMYAHRRKRA